MRDDALWHEKRQFSFGLVPLLESGKIVAIEGLTGLSMEPRARVRCVLPVLGALEDREKTATLLLLDAVDETLPDAKHVQCREVTRAIGRDCMILVERF